MFLEYSWGKRYQIHQILDAGGVGLGLQVVGIVFILLMLCIHAHNRLFGCSQKIISNTSPYNWLIPALLLQGGSLPT